MKDKKTGKITAAGLFAAIICIATAMFPIKLAHGFVNAGDGFIILAGMFLGGAYGAISGAVGSALADLVSGYVFYAPATFVIKGLMALCAAAIYKNIKIKYNVVKKVLSALAAETIMVGGYFVFECFVYGAGAAAADVAGNTLQAAAGIVISFILGNIAEKTPAIKKYLLK